MPAKHLTDAAVKAAITAHTGNAVRLDLRDTVAPGLVLRVTGQGVASFAFQYRPKGSRGWR